ncbi:MAG: hypothetical protein BWY43_00363 [candidate division WS2 bacterium ADurb.Bin280]|uniref:Uncharacterized protein n=1 Tax=candidate division WS2 bacterium ADurb.Bin280 TaxID=1852829 RepID=A0A1V5SFE5_9BACT|nr:MAG: hypothetical protein BWY43_00363 [candidate division WS2 bacterium ADurb.Bin280]
MEEVKKKGSSVDGHKLVMTLIFIAVTAVIFLAIGYVAGKNEVDNQQTALVEDTATTTTTALKSTTATTSATADETASWKTYTNEEYGFTLKYPDSANILTKENGRLLDDSMIVAFEWETNQDVEADVDLVDSTSVSDETNAITSIPYGEKYLQLRISKQSLTDYSSMVSSFKSIE